MKKRVDGEGEILAITIEQDGPTTREAEGRSADRIEDRAGMNFFPAKLDEFRFDPGLLNLVQRVSDQSVRVSILVGISIECDYFHMIPRSDLFRAV
ncbi:hypothetical protein [Methanosphaerula palustris]|uniref:hypothetical protein n=1 Tax=Methanosphaerula palustris TaxID=475088 RepID=UPI0001848B05|nr:hypothetical protein [Methanosphaerula palustris]